MGAGYHGGFGNTDGATHVNNDNKKYETDESLKSELRSNKGQSFFLCDSSTAAPAA